MFCFKIPSKGGDRVDIIKTGTDDLNEADLLSCCWPPGVEDVQSPALA